METNEKIKLVVFNEHTIGYINPNSKNYVQVLHASILKGATFALWPSSVFINSSDNVRLASEKDFDNFRCSFDGYKESGEYEYQHN